ncbi:MAG: DUF2156 domain-containing protein [Myxococcales bacterium]|nr:DUF2156 domain-containing protein [Myxococcales bacterium]
MLEFLSQVPELPACRPLALADQPFLAARFATEPSGTSEMTFTNLFAWSGSHPVFLARWRNTLLLWRGPRERGYLLPPYGEPLDRIGIRAVLAWAAAMGGAPRFARLPASAAHRLHAVDPELSLVADRDQADYVYLREELATLSGRKFDGKRNLIKKFEKSVAAVYQPLDADLVAFCLEMQKDWCEVRECSEHPDLDAENEAVCRALEYWDRLPLFGGALLTADGPRRILAFTVAERLTADTAVIHFEKGTTQYPGVYQALNRLFCEKALAAMTFVNREQDLGLPGLRQAKESYHPHHLVEKFILQPTG